MTTTPRTTRAQSPIVQAASELDKLKRTRAKLITMLAEIDRDIIAIARRITDLVGAPLSDSDNGAP